MGFEKIYEKIGKFGKYQKVLYIICSGGVFLPGMQNTASLYLQHTPEFTCEEPAFPNCTTFSAKDSFSNSDCDCSNFNSFCTFGDLFNNTEPTTFKTVSTEFLLICDRDKFNTWTTSAYFVGFFIGSFLAGLISDNYGRKSTLILGLIGNLVVGVFTSYSAFEQIQNHCFLQRTPHSTNWWQYMLFRALVGLFANMCLVSSFVYVSEMIGSNEERSFYTIHLNSFYALGYTTLTIIAYFVRDWRKLQYILSLCSIPVIFCCMLIPESIRFLVVKCKLSDAHRVINAYAAYNEEEKEDQNVDLGLSKIRRSSSIVSRSEVKCIMDEVDKEETQVGLVSLKTLLTRSFMMNKVLAVCVLSWFANSVVYYGLSLGTTNLSKNIFVTNIIMALVELPSYYLVSVILTKNIIGRRTAHAMFLTLAGIFCILSTFTKFLSDNWEKIGQKKDPFENDIHQAQFQENHFENQDPTNHIFTKSALENTSFILAILGKFSVAASFGIIWSYTSELFPTIVRSTAISVCSMMARLGGIFTPFLLNLYVWNNYAPGVIFGVLAFVVGIISINLPETAGRQMVMSIEDANELYEEKNKRKEELEKCNSWKAKRVCSVLR